jgi:uncharacterized protein (DUF1697 family)
MPAQVAFLRAINVGHRQVKMDRLREVLTGLGLTGVRTHIASGNVWFASRSTGGQVEARIEAAIEDAFGFEVETFVRSREELAGILEAIPFAAREVESAHALMICFLREAPDPASAREVAALGNATDRFAVVGRELFWLRLVRDSDPRIQKAVEKLLPGPMTGRKVKTVQRMAAG